MEFDFVLGEGLDFADFDALTELGFEMWHPDRGRTVYQLTRDELQELKINYYSQNQEISYQEMLDIDDLVSDQEIQEAYRNTQFVTDDFFCNNHFE